MRTYRNTLALPSILRGLTAITLLVAFPLAGCGSVSTSGSPPPQILRMSDEGVQDLTNVDLDPAAESLGANAIFVINLVLGGLVRLDSNLHVAPDGAKSWTVSKDGRTYTFHIRSGLKFADGTPVTASDFAYSLQRALSPKYASNGTNLYYLSAIQGATAYNSGKSSTLPGIKVINPSTLQIKTNAPTAAFLDQLTYSAAYVVPKKLIQKYGDKAWTEHTVGTGPFYVKRWQHSKEIDLAPNPYYWRGKPKLTQVRILFMQNADTAYNLYRTGGLDVMGTVQFPSDKLASAKHQSNFTQKPFLFTEYIPPNEKKYPFGNVHVRRAFSLAIDRNTLVNKFLGGQFTPANGILPPGIPGYNPHVKGETFNPALAKKELARAGFPNGKNFPKTTLTFSGGDPGQASMSPVLQRMWSQYLGINVNLNQMEAGAYNDALTARNYQLAFISWGEDYPDPQDFLSLQLQTGVGNNNGSFSDPRFDALTKLADTLVGHDAQRHRLYDQAEQIALDKAAWIVLYWGKTDTLINPKVHGLRINAGGLTADNWATVSIQ
jgi:oligopeptide transport system substrate-binding protein